MNGRPVARTARAPDSKSGGWGFESLLACQFRFHGGECGSTRLEHWVVAPGVGGSSPLTHPIKYNREFNFKGDRYASHDDRPYLYLSIIITLRRGFFEHLLLALTMFPRMFINFL